jgi:hypothetical protein
MLYYFEASSRAHINIPQYGPSNSGFVEGRPGEGRPGEVRLGEVRRNVGI